MAIQYQTDEQGRRVAVVVPLAQWELLQDIRPGDPEDGVTPEEAARMAQAWEEYRRGEFSDLDDVRKRLLGDES